MDTVLGLSQEANQSEGLSFSAYITSEVPYMVNRKSIQN